jgi:hypothetical protein
MHTLTSHRLNPSTVYEYKIAAIDSKNQLHYSDTYQIHTPDLDYRKSFKFLATGDIVSIFLSYFMIQCQLTNIREL